MNSGSKYAQPAASDSLFDTIGAGAKALTDTAKTVATAPTRTVKVRAHTRTIAAKPTPTLAQTVDDAASGLTSAAAKVATQPAPKITKAVAAAKPPPPIVPPPVNTQTVRPAQVSTLQRFVPHYPGEPIAGYTHGIKNPDGTWDLPGGARPQPGAIIAERPYYTDASTMRQRAGPPGQASTQWNAAQVAAAKRIQVANYGLPGYILRSALPGGADEGGINAGNAVSRTASALSFLPGGGIGEAAGILGFGLKGLRGARAAKDVVEAAPVARFTEINPGRYAEPRYSVPVEDVAKITTQEPRVFRKGYEKFREDVAHRGIIQPLDVFYNPDTQKIWLAQGHHRLQAAEDLGHTHVPITLKTTKAEAPHNAQTGTPSSVFGIGQESAALVPATKGRVLRGTVSPQIPEEAAAVRAAMPGAKILRGKQEAGYSIERSKRAAAARVHLENQALTPAERVGKAKGELVGELPKIDFGGFKELNDQSLQALQTHILDHPHLLPFQKIRASDALVNALSGRVPTRSEITLLEHVFGKQTAAGLGAVSTSPFRDRILSALNVPRSIMASFDLSAPFRQGLMVSTRHPAIFARNLGSMVKAFGSEKVYQAALDEIHARPTYPMMLEAKLPFTELGRDLSAREEQFASDYAEKIPVAGRGIRASGRAYTGFLDKTRADVFDHLIRQAQAQGINVQDQKFLRSLGKYIGSATGRGDLGAFQEAGKVLNTFFFSPRLLASRLNFLNPVYYARLDPFARKEALRSALQLAGTLSTLLALASRVPGVKVATDPRNPDWGKIRIGNTRVDIAGGFQQELRLLAQLATGVAISSTTGKKLALTAGGFGQPTRLDIALRFFEGKESPLASLVTDWLRGSSQIGQKFSWSREAAQRMTPLLAQDSYDLYNEKNGGVNGITAAFAGYGLGSFGFGLQTYNPTKPKAGAGTPPNSDYGGSGSPYSSPSQSSGSVYAGP